MAEKNPWLDDVILALRNLGGEGQLHEIYEEVTRIRSDLPTTFDATVRRTLEQHCPASKAYLGRGDHFRTINGFGKGRWGLSETATAQVGLAFLPDEPTLLDTPERRSRVIDILNRRSKIVSDLKAFHDNTCQLCESRIEIGPGEFYSEGHHIQPLGGDHRGPDVKDNILILCPNCHVQCDYKAFRLSADLLKGRRRRIGRTYLDYHNNLVEQKS